MFVDYSINITLLVLFVFSFYIVKFLFYTKQKSSISHQVVVITGASSGLGKECAFAFLKQNCKLVLCSRRIDELNKIKNELQSLSENLGFSADVHAIMLDISNFDDIEKAIPKILQISNGRIDILLNNAGISFRGHIQTTDLSVYEKIMKVNFLGQVAFTKAVLPIMIEQGSGHIVGIGSVQGKIAQPYRAPYTASKHACQAFYDSIRAELSQYKIEVTVINPSYIKTNLSSNAITGDGSVYGRMDESTASGLSPTTVAESVIEAVRLKKKEVMLAPFHHKAAVWIRLFCPSLYFWIMNRRKISH